MIHFAAAPVLWLLLLLPLIAVWRVRRQQAFLLSLTHAADGLPWTWRRSTHWIVPALRMLGISALIVAAAQPYDWNDSRLFPGRGIAIELIIDRSGSMREDDYLLEGQRVSRLRAVVDAASRFVIGTPQTDARHQDMIGLVIFAREAEAVCPLTLDHEQVVAMLEQVEAAADYRDDGTAIGDAVGLAVAELQSLEQSLRSRDPLGQLTRIIVLLTDGEQNAGELAPAEAMQLAAHYGIRVYVIALRPSRRAAGGEPTSAALSHHQQMRTIAEAAGGSFFDASDTSTLRTIYASINALEQSRLMEQRLVTRRQWAIDWFHLGPFGVPPIALVALLAMAAESLLRHLVYPKVL